MRQTLILLLILLGGALSLRAQTGSKESDSLARLKDLRDIADSIFNHHAKPEPATAGGFHNSPFPAVGYTLATGIAAVFSDRMDFHTGDTSGKITDILSSVTYSQYNQIIAQSYADIWAGHDKYNIIADWRYMKYPSTTFGLGGHTQYTDGYTIDFNYIKLHTTVMRYVAPNLYLGLGYYFDYFNGIKEVDPPPGVVTSFQKYGLTPTEAGSGPVARALYDSRDNPPNPLRGWYASVTYHPSFPALGSQGYWATLQIDARKYIKLRDDGRNVLALWQFDWLSVGGKTPYLLLPSTGWDDMFNTGRGYIQGRYRGTDMEYLEAEDRFTISRNGLIGGVVFANVETFKKALAAPQLHDFDPGWGAGIRIKLNKHSNTNICVDYGWGLQGSQGIAVNVGEVF
jgi:hypothetical protein